jgi:hypothetical protein
MQHTGPIISRCKAYGDGGPLDGSQPLRSEDGCHAILERIAGFRPVLGKDERPTFPIECIPACFLFFTTNTQFPGDPSWDAVFPPYRILFAGVG